MLLGKSYLGIAVRTLRSSARGYRDERVPENEFSCGRCRQEMGDCAAGGRLTRHWGIFAPGKDLAYGELCQAEYSSHQYVLGPA